MILRVLVEVFTAVDPDSPVFVCLFKEDGTSEVFDILDVSESNGDVRT